MRDWITALITVLIIGLALSMLLFGCTKDLYQPQPFQSVRIVGDTRATVTFPVRMPDGSIQMVVTGLTLRDGWEAKELTPDEAARQAAALRAAMTAAATQPSK